MSNNSESTLRSDTDDSGTSDPDAGTAPDAGHQELAIFSPVLPPARFVELADRGTVMVRDFGGPSVLR